ncbi:MAG: hypothetical protein PVH40_05470 [Gemmatimonadales bacterium]|jgi:hypothetical protein
MILPDKQDRGVVVFWVWPSLTYEIRMVAAFVLIAAGCVMQFVARELVPGVLPVALGNLLLLVKGYDNRIDFGAFDPEAQWERVDREKLQELKELDRKIKRWDRTSLEISNPLGLFVFLVVIAALAASVVMGTGLTRIVAIDAAILLIPHWLTGIRSTLRAPGLLVRIEAIENVLEGASRQLGDHRVTVLMLLTGREAKLPEDVKFKVDFAGQHADFLGLYGQVVLNDVQGTSYPYFYVVLVAKQGFGLRDVYDRYQPDSGITKEFKVEDKVEVMVIRQFTTKKSGYHTKQPVANSIFLSGLSLAEQVATRVAA